METNFDDILKQSATNFVAEAPNESWGFIADALHRKKKRRYFWFFFLGLFTATLVGGGIYFSKISSKNDYAVKSEKEYFNTKDSSLKTPKNIDYLKEENIIDTITNEKIKTVTSKNKVDVKKLKINSTNEKIYKKENIKYSTNKKQNISVISSDVVNDEVDYVKEIMVDNIINKEKVIAPDQENIKINKNELEIFIDSLVQKKETKEIKKEFTKLDSGNILHKAIVLPKRKQSINFIFQLNYEQLYVNKNNLLTKLSSAEKASFTRDNATYASPQGVVGVRPSSNNNSIYNNGKAINLAFLINKQTKKRLAFNLGVNFKYSEYSVKAYQAIPLGITNFNNTLISDSVANFPNSFYGTNASITSSSNKINSKNKFYDVGIIAGVNYNFLKLKKLGSLNIQTQIATDLSFNNSINLLNKTNGRFFSDKSLTKKFNVYQNFSLLYFNKNNNYSVGPVYTFMYNKINKDIVNLGLLNTSSFGLQFQYFFKPNKKK